MAPPCSNNFDSSLTRNGRTNTTNSTPVVSSSSPSDQTTPPPEFTMTYGSNVAERDARQDQQESKETTSAISHRGTIGWMGSMAIAVNSLAGPAMLDLPATYQRSGFIPTTLTLLSVCILSAFCSLHMANVVSKVPGNANFGKQVEFSEPFSVFWGRSAFLVTQLVFYLCSMCQSIASIVDVAQVLDRVLANQFGGSTGVRINRNLEGADVVTWSSSDCSRDVMEDGTCVPFNDVRSQSLLLTLGHLLTACIFLPICLMNLKENTTWQIVGFVVFVTNSLYFAVAFLREGEIDFNNMTLWGTSWVELFGVVLFNFAVVLAIPAWLYEKKPSVNVSTVIHGSAATATILFILVGSLGALSVRKMSENMLESMMSGLFGKTTQLGAECFAFFIIGLDIPLFSVLARLNLTASGLCSERTGNLLAVYLPWSLSWLFYGGKALTGLLSWGGILFTSVIAFLAPLFLALLTLNKSTSPHQKSNDTNSEQGTHNEWLSLLPSSQDTDVDETGARRFDEAPPADGGGGSIAVYGGWITSKRGYALSLYCLISFSAVAIAIAIVGEFLSEV